MAVDYSNKMFCNISPCEQYDKCFTIVIYDRNGSDLYYKTKIPANLDLARSVKYNHNLWSYSTL
jgi:hypothetical protein